GVVVGLFIGIAIGVMVEGARPRIERELDMPGEGDYGVAGNIPRIRRFRGPVQATGDARIQSALRAVLARAVAAAGTGNGTAVLGVTSPAGSHGRTTVALGLAATAVRRGGSAVVVD